MFCPTLSQDRPNAVKIVVLQDQAMVGELLSRVLSGEADIQVVGTAGTISEARNLIRDTRPNLVLVDALLSDGSGVDLVHHVKAEYPGTRVILLTSCEEEESVLSAIEAGVEGYVVKSSHIESLLESIKLVMDGKQSYDSVVVSPMLQRIVKATPRLAYRQAGTTNQALSAREREVVRLISRGLTNKEIASELSLSIHTVKSHVRKVLQRLGISSRRELLPGRRSSLDS